jgi:hypothetical protein
MVIAHVEINGGCVRELFHLLESLRDLRQRVLLTNDSLIELSEISEKSHGAVTLGDNESG